MFNAATIEEARRLKESIYDEYQDVANEAVTINCEIIANHLAYTFV